MSYSVRLFSQIGANAPDSVNGWCERWRELNATRARRNIEETNPDETKRGLRAALHRICKIVSARKSAR
jgi:hypothetical protein